MNFECSADLTAYFALMAARSDWFVTPAGGVEILTSMDDINAAVADMSLRYSKRGMPASWAHVGLCYSDPYLMVLRDAVRFPDGNTGIHHRAVRHGEGISGVAILPVMDNKILLLQHFRHPTRQWHWEFPRGAIEPGATAEETIVTELHEEIEGIVAGFEPLGRMYGATGFMGLGVWLYLAKLSGFGMTARGEGIVATRLVAPAEFEAMVLGGEITDSFTLGAYLHAKLRGLL